MPESSCDSVGHWRVLREEIMAAIQEWRLQHPQPTLQEIEVAGGRRLTEGAGAALMRRCRPRRWKHSGSGTGRWGHGDREPAGPGAEGVAGTSEALSSCSRLIAAEPCGRWRACGPGRFRGRDCAIDAGVAIQRQTVGVATICAMPAGPPGPSPPARAQYTGLASSGAAERLPRVCPDGDRAH